MRKETGVKPANVPFYLAMLLILCIALLALVSRADAQDTPAETLSQEELEQILAPIALYPDDLLSQVLVASTYPLEVVEADRWLDAHKDLKGDALKSAVKEQGWDESVKSLVATPDVLKMMSEKLDWTQKLGDAVLAQQDDVMKAAQSLRSRAYNEKTLQSNEQQTVNVTQDAGQETIIIQSAAPETVYVPYYNPTIVYGAWPYPSYPPVYYPNYYPVATAVASGIAFAAGVAIWDDVWDGDFNWGHGDIDVDINKNININDIDIKNRKDNLSGRTKWQHNPEHRHGVQYDNNKVRQKFGQNISGQAQRQEFRGRMDNNIIGGQTRQENIANQLGKQKNLGGQTQHQNLQNRAQQHAQGSPQQRPQNNRPNMSSVNSSLGGHDNAFSGMSSGKITQRHADRGYQSFSRSSLGASSRSSGGARSFGGGSGGRLGGGGFRR